MDMHTSPNQQQAGLIPFIVIGVISLAFGVILALLLPALGVLPEQASAQAQNTDALFTVLILIGGVVFALVQILIYYAAIRFRAKPTDTTDGPSIHGNTMLEIVWTVIPSVIVVVLAILSFIQWRANIEPSETPNLVNGESIQVNAYGQRYAWSFEYLTNDVDYNDEQLVFSDSELHVYVGQDVELQMETTDVIHSFWVPAMRVKQDLLPGRVTEVRFTPVNTGEWEYTAAFAPFTIYTEESDTSEIVYEATATEDAFTPSVSLGLVNIDEDVLDSDGNGWVEVISPEGDTGFIQSSSLVGRHNEYRLICTELCGGGHGQMWTNLIVHESEEAYLASFYDPVVVANATPPADLIVAGRNVIDSYGCSGCHVLESFPSWQGVTGPNQTGIGSRVGDRAAELDDVESGAEYLAQSIRHPGDYLVPGYSNQMRVYDPAAMPQDDLIAIVAFLCTQTNSSDPEDSTCGLDNWSFDDSGSFDGDTGALVEELENITDEYE
jgi:cytochrome c oxidase subunit 2